MFGPVSSRIIQLKVEAEPFNYCFIQVYALTGDYSQEDIDLFYEDLNRGMKEAKSDEVVVVIGE